MISFFALDLPWIYPLSNLQVKRGVKEILIISFENFSEDKIV